MTDSLQSDPTGAWVTRTMSQEALSSGPSMPLAVRHRAKGMEPRRVSMVMVIVMEALGLKLNIQFISDNDA